MSSYSDGDFTLAAVNGGKQTHFPFEGDDESVYTEQEFIQSATSFRALPLNSPDPEDPTSFLVMESARRDLGGGLVGWTRTYARVPKQRDEYETLAYTFPGFGITWGTEYFVPWAGAPTLGTAPAIRDPGRSPITRKVTCRVRHDFFLVGAHGVYEMASDVPLLTGQRYVYGAGFGANAGGDLPDKVLWQASAVNGIANWTSPTIEAFRALITAGTEIIADDSELHRWKGNIYERITRYVVAQ